MPAWEIFRVSVERHDPRENDSFSGVRTKGYCLACFLFRSPAVNARPANRFTIVRCATRPETKVDQVR
jgi:hypothetical protein